MSLAIVDRRRGRGRSKKYWGDVIRHDIVSAFEGMSVDRRSWIRVEN